MANTVKKMFRGAASLSNTTLYTVPAATSAVVTNISLVNTAGSAATATLKLDDVDILTTFALAANSITSLDVRHVLETGGTIKGSASAITVNFHISGMEIA